MSKDIIVLTPNGRRQKIHCTPDTSFLQVLEDVCNKQGFQPSNYDLKHHNHTLDLTTTLRYSNLPNKALVEMVEAEKRRKESNVTIGLQLEDGERRTADFPPTATLYEIVIKLATSEVGSLQHPTILYMRQEIVGEFALRDKTLRQLGLIQGRAVLRLMNKQEEARQANVSSVYRKATSITKVADIQTEVKLEKLTPDQPSTSSTKDNTQIKQDEHHQPDILTKLKQDILQQTKLKGGEEVMDQEIVTQEIAEPIKMKKENVAMDVDSNINAGSTHSQENLERRLKIEEEVTFLGNQKAIAFMQSNSVEDQLEDLPDDFYDLSVDEVRKLYHDLQQNRLSLENTPLLSSTQREQNSKQASEQTLNLYKHVVVRIQFPDHMILQGIFTPTNTIEDVMNFIKEFLHNPNKKFHIFTTPIKETLVPKMTLMEAKFVPCVHMHFKWLENDPTETPYLKEDIYSRKTEPDAANILASKYRAPSRRRDDSASSQTSNKPSTSRSNKVPRWLK